MYIQHRESREARVTTENQQHACCREKNRWSTNPFQSFQTIRVQVIVQVFCVLFGFRYYVCMDSKWDLIWKDDGTIPTIFQLVLHPAL